MPTTTRTPDLIGIWIGGVITVLIGAVLATVVDAHAVRVLGLYVAGAGGVVLLVAAVATGVVLGGRILRLDRR